MERNTKKKFGKKCPLNCPFKKTDIFVFALHYAKPPELPPPHTLPLAPEYPALVNFIKLMRIGVKAFYKLIFQL